MAAAFAKRERDRRGVENQLDVLTGGTRPADRVHDEVLTVMRERGFDLSDRTPREITVDEIREADYVITMGCSAQEVCPVAWSGESRDWGLDDPAGRNLDAVRGIRDEIERRVGALFDELLATRETV